MSRKSISRAKKEHTQVGETVIFGQTIKIFQQGFTVGVRADTCQFQKTPIGNRIEIIGIHGLGISEFIKTDPPFLLEKFDDLVAGEFLGIGKGVSFHSYLPHMGLPQFSIYRRFDAGS